MELDQRLKAVLAADVAGYARLMSIDERSTIISLNAARTIFRDKIESHRGRLVDMAGDSVLAVFDTAIAATTSAIAIQIAINASEVDLPEERRLRFRIGLHMGDILEGADGTVYGDGINIAARLQTLAQPGGVVVSLSVHSIVRGRLTSSFTDLGEQSIKNIEYPVHALAMEIPTASVTGKVGSSTAAAKAVVDMSAPVPGFGGRPAIAVLPFDNLSAEPDQEFFADGLAEDILTRLAMWRLFPVIARNSSFLYRGRQVDVREVGRTLGARWVLEGSVRRSKSMIRVTAQLIDAETGHHVWADRYDRTVDDLFTLQDELTEGIVGALEDRVGRVVIERVRVKAPTSLEAWEAVHRAVWHLYRMTKTDTDEARALCMRALELSPEMPHALAILANLHRIDALFLGGNTRASLAEAVACASRAFAADENDPWACGTLGLILATVGRLEESQRVSVRAIELNPSGTLGYNGLGTASLFMGDWDAGIQAMSTAVRINPADQMLSASLTALAFNHLMKGDFERAVDIGRLAVQHQPVFPGAARILASALGHLGQIEEGARVLGDARSRIPGKWPESSFRATLPFREESALQHYLDGLRNVGWTG